MYILLLTYTAPLDAVDAELEAHKAWVGEHFATGAFVLAGRRVPRSGGFILATGIGREELDRIIAADPFVTAGVAVYDVYEVAPTKAADALKGLLPAG